ncbi:hypothetical protein LCGC14_0043490 [marine sediment metagenome]|uniref:Uncharacterized protein n=1 Tax=marine sediment metagenome TaxID=412755 RepID=A0A0F9VTH7_9ZZZZ
MSGCDQLLYRDCEVVPWYGSARVIVNQRQYLVAVNQVRSGWVAALIRPIWKGLSIVIKRFFEHVRDPLRFDRCLHDIGGRIRLAEVYEKPEYRSVEDRQVGRPIDYRVSSWKTDDLSVWFIPASFRHLSALSSRFFEEAPLSLMAQIRTFASLSKTGCTARITQDKGHSPTGFGGAMALALQGFMVLFRGYSQRQYCLTILRN